jgi:hypothetical protein
MSTEFVPTDTEPSPSNTNSLRILIKKPLSETQKKPVSTATVLRLLTFEKVPNFDITEEGTNADTNSRRTLPSVRDRGTASRKNSLYFEKNNRILPHHSMIEKSRLVR